MTKMCKIILTVAAVLFSGLSFVGVSGHAEPIIIEFNTLFHEADARAMEIIIDLFNETHDDIHVELIQGRWAVYYTDLRLSVIAGTPPQLGISHANRLVEMSDFFTPLDDSPVGDLLAGAGFTGDDFMAANWAAGQLEGRRYLIPLDTHGWGVWFNKDIFVAAGLDPNNPPQTLAEFIAASEAIKAAGYFAFHPAEDALPRKVRRAWYIFFWQAGGELFNEDHTRATFNNPKGLLALQFLVNIFHDFGWNVVGGNGVAQFVAGELGMVVGGNWHYRTMQKSGINWGYMPMPNFFGTPYSWGNSHALQIPVQPRGTPKEVYEATMTVIEFIVENSHIWTIEGGHITAHLDALTSPDLLASEYWIRSGHLLAKMAEAGLIRFPINHPRGTALEHAIQAHIELAVKGEITPAEALDRAEAEVNRILQGD